MAIWILRTLFLVAVAGASFAFVNTAAFEETGNNNALTVFTCLLLGSLALVAADAAIPRKRIDMISSIYFGILVGLFLTFVLGSALAPVLGDSDLVPGLRVIVSFVLCYICISVLIQTKDDFRFVIPYVEFAKEIKGLKPYVLDTSVVIDGRISDVV